MSVGRMYNSRIPSETKEGMVGTLIATIAVLVLVSSPFVFLGVTFLLGAIKEAKEWFGLRRQGIIVEGRITNRREKPTRGTPNYYVTYGYDYDGQTYSREQQVRKKQYQALENGSNVAVLCMSSHPQVATLEGTPNTALLLPPLVEVGLLAVLGLGLLGAVIFLWYEFLLKP